VLPLPLLPQRTARRLAEAMGEETKPRERTAWKTSPQHAADREPGQGRGNPGIRRRGRGARGGGSENRAELISRL